MVAPPTETERGLASIGLNHPQVMLNVVSETAFSTAYVADPLSKHTLDIVLDLAARNATIDVRVVFERLRELMSGVSFAQLTDLYTLMPLASVAVEYVGIIKAAARRRNMVSTLTECLTQLDDAAVRPDKVAGELTTELEKIRRDIAPPNLKDTKTLLIDALRRYQTGDDKALRVSSGYPRIDNITPIRLGDFLVIGGPEKSGKTMLALNIIANILKNETSQFNTARD